MPDRANPSKADAIRRLGAEVVFHGHDFDEAREWIKAQAASKSARFISPTERELIAGVGTYTLEVTDDGVRVLTVQNDAGEWEPPGRYWPPGFER